MRNVVILIALLFVGLAGYAQERSWTGRKRVSEIMEKNSWSKEKAVLEYQRMHRSEIWRLEDEFYLGRDTLYLLWEVQDSLEFRDNSGRYVWRMDNPKNLCGDSEWLPTFIRKYKSLYDRFWSFRKGYGVSLTANQLEALRPVGRKELADFFRRELNRESQINKGPYGLVAWGDWNLLDYFPKVYFLVPQGGDFYDMYECEY